MEKFFQKITLYDFLTAVLFGGCLYYVFEGCNWLHSINNSNFWVSIFSCYVVGLVVHKMVESVDFSKNKCFQDKDKCKFCSFVCSPICRNQVSMIEEARKEVGIEECKDIMSEYYKTYYELADRNKLSNIPTLEAHSAFLKDLMLVFIIMIFKLVCCSSITMLECIHHKCMAFFCVGFLVHNVNGSKV
ncbi:MAG: hypothetical protein ACI3Y4_03445 [Candidatus Cryptobacteroides sp.]